MVWYLTMLQTTEIAKKNKKKTIQNETLVIADLILMSTIVGNIFCVSFER